MKKIFSILLLGLMLIPLYWNGMSLIHYMVEHTHTFCTSEQNHEHSSTEDCHAICHITPQHDHGQIPNTVEFYELKQCVTTLSFFNHQFSFFNYTSTYSDYSLLRGRMLLADIFRPPIS